MLYAFRRFWASIIRAGNSKGFGIQSPFAFEFVTKVVRAKKSKGFHTGHSLQSNGLKTEIRLRRFYSRLLEYLNEKGVVDKLVIIEDIHRDSSSYKLWKEIIEDEFVTVSFDLYDCGVLFFDKKWYKCNYKVMLL